MKANSVGKFIGIEIKDELLEMIEQAGDEGMTFKQVGAAFELSYDHAHAAVLQLSEMGVLKLANRSDRNVIRIVLPDWVGPERLDLTKKQQAAVDFMAMHMDDDGATYLSFRDITFGAGLSKGGIVATLDALDKKGFIEFISRGRGTAKTWFRVYPNGDGPRGYSPMKPMYRSGVIFTDNPETR